MHAGALVDTAPNGTGIFKGIQFDFNCLEPDPRTVVDVKLLGKSVLSATMFGFAFQEIATANFGRSTPRLMNQRLCVIGRTVMSLGTMSQKQRMVTCSRLVNDVGNTTVQCPHMSF